MSKQIDILSAQIGTLWMVLRAFGAAHPNRPALISELEKCLSREIDHGVALPLGDDALQLAQEQLQEMLVALRALNTDK
jgi:hypothetical protein